MKKKSLILMLMLVFTLTGCGAAKTEEVSSFKPEISKEINRSMIANPWGDTQSLSVAVESSEVDFTPPPETALPDDVELTTYRYMEGMIEALYSQTENEMLIRKSYSHEGTGLSGDYTKYSKTWDETVEDICIHCSGDGESINLAYFDKENGHFSILYNAGNEGKGLSKDQLKTLVQETE